MYDRIFTLLYPEKAVLRVSSENGIEHCGMKIKVRGDFISVAEKQRERGNYDICYKGNNVPFIKDGMLIIQGDTI